MATIVHCHLYKIANHFFFFWLLWKSRPGCRFFLEHKQNVMYKKCVYVGFMVVNSTPNHFISLVEFVNINGAYLVQLHAYPLYFLLILVYCDHLYLLPFILIVLVCQWFHFPCKWCWSSLKLFHRIWFW